MVPGNMAFLHPQLYIRDHIQNGSAEVDNEFVPTYMISLEIIRWFN